jgi:hypothetical protein
VRQRVHPIVAEYGYSVSYGGQFEAQQSAARTLYVFGAGVVLLVLLLLNMSFGSTRAALLVMINMPLALIGGRTGQRDPGAHGGGLAGRTVLLDAAEPDRSTGRLCAGLAGGPQVAPVRRGGGGSVAAIRHRLARGPRRACMIPPSGEAGR